MIGDQGEVGQCRIAWPYPQPFQVLRHLESLHAAVRRDHVLTGDVGAVSVDLEAQTMIAADHSVAVDPSAT